MEAPRGHAKTTIKCFLIPIFQALEETASFQHYLNVQSTQEKALTVNTSIRLELEENELLRRMYGDQVGRAKWTDSQFVLSNGVIFTAIGAGQSIKGINYRNKRPDYILVDDLYDEKDVHNFESTERKSEWFWGSLYKARAIGRRTSMHVQGTAVNGSDLLEELKSKERWKSRTFKAVVDFDSRQLLWKELPPEAKTDLLADIDDMPTVVFNREMQNERRDDAESLVKEAWLADWEYDAIPSNLIVLGAELNVDPSIGEKEQSDYTGAVLIVKTRHPDALPGAVEYWIEDVWNEHWSLNQRVLKLDAIRQREVDRERSIRHCNVEAVAGFNDFAAELSRRTKLPVRRVNPKMDKLAHLESKSHHFENKRVHLRRGIDKKVKDVVRFQLTHNDAKHDDVRDAILIGLDGAKTGSWGPVA